MMWLGMAGVCVDGGRGMVGMSGSKSSAVGGRITGADDSSSV